MSDAPSLSLRLGADGMSVLLTARDTSLPIERIATRWLSAERRAPNQIEVGLDDLLSGLGALGDWPEPESVVWEDELRLLVEDSLLDAQAAESRLVGDTREHDWPDSDTPLGQRWSGDLTSFQLRDLAALLQLRHGANFSVPGAGKTRVALALYEAIKVLGHVERVLVVCPKSAYQSWVDEADAVYSDRPTIQVFEGGAISAATEVLIINYERLPDARMMLSRWLGAMPSMLILDEAHRMKLGAAGAYGSACLALGPRARRRLILTGTPAPNGADDLRSLFSFVWPGEGRRVVDSAVGDGDLKRASEVLRPFFVRTTKNELDLPPLRPIIRRVDMPSAHREIYSALVGQMSNRAQRSQGDAQALGKIIAYLLMAADSPALLTTGSSRYEPLEYRVPPLDVPESASLNELLRDLPNYEFSPKYAETLHIVATNAALGRKTLVWSTFIRSLATLNKMLAAFHPAMVHGGSDDREGEIRRFRSDPNCMVLLSNPATLGEGISLHHVCHDAVYVDRDFAAGRYLQSLDRIHRLGLPTNTVTNITVLVANGTIDEVVENRLASKLTFLAAVLDDPAVEQLGDLSEEDSVGAALSPADLSALMGFLHAPLAT